MQELEDYIIAKYNPYVIDLSQYFMGDETQWENLNGAHFEKEFYRETFTQVIKIIFGQTDKRYFSEPDFFNVNRRGYEEDKLRKFDVENGIQTMELLKQRLFMSECIRQTGCICASRRESYKI
nr:hypothetical protein [uncultured Clostridium sp.]